MNKYNQRTLQVLSETEQHQLDGGVYLFGPDVHIAPKFPYSTTDPIGGLIRIEFPLMMTNGGVVL
jgi:hypothetical protein